MGIILFFNIVPTFLWTVFIPKICIFTECKKAVQKDENTLISIIIIYGK
jgi:hypothetical protein